MTTPVSPEEALARALHDTLYHSMSGPEGGFRWYWTIETGERNDLAAAILAAIEGYRLVPAEDVDRLVNAAHRMAKWTSIQKGEDGGAFVHAMRQANTAEADTFRALGAFGISMTDKPPAAIKEHSDAV
jgi:hypothetical protein